MAKSERKPKRGRKTTASASSLKYTFPVVIEKDRDGYFAACPSLQGCFTQGETYEDTLHNIQEAISLHIEGRLAHGETIPSGESVSLTTVEVEV